MKKLQKADISNSQQDSFYLLEYATGINRGKYYANQHQKMPKKEQEDYIALIHKRCERIPLQHLLGTTEFMGLPFKVNSHVLIPRQDTEILVETALKVIKTTWKKDCEREELLILDMCTGSGCILISTLYYARKDFPKIRGVGVDISKEALKLAKDNAKKNGINVAEMKSTIDFIYGGNQESLDNASHDESQIVFVESDLFSKLKDLKKDTKIVKKGYNKKYDIILSNPPYIPSKEIEDLEEEVKHHDPLLALDGGEDGLYFYGQITKECPKYLNKEGTLILECGWNQGEEVSRVMKDHGFTNVKVIKDLNGLDRVIVGNYG